MQQGHKAVGFVDVVCGLAAVKCGFDLSCAFVELATLPIGGFPREGVTIPAIEGNAEILVINQFPALRLGVATACTTGNMNNGLAVFKDAATECVVGVVSLNVLTGALYHAIEVVPDEFCGLPIVCPLDQVATRVVFVVCADVLLEQVVEHDVDFWGVLVCTRLVVDGVVLNVFGVVVGLSDVPCGIEGEQFLAQSTVGFKQPTHGVICIANLSTASIADLGELTEYVVAVAALVEREIDALFGINVVDQLLFEPTCWVVL